MIDPQTFAILFLVALLGLGALGVHIAVIMMVIALVTAWATLGTGVVLNLGNLGWSVQTDFILVAAPLFILMGEILLRSGISDRMYNALAAWTSRIPGGLLHTNIAASAMFSATSGSSVATAATIGTVALPAFQDRGYSERMALGSLVAGGTLGILIPPSVNLVVYGAMTDTSIGRLFAAGLVPGILMALLFSLTIVVFALVRPQIAGAGEARIALRDRVWLLKDLIPPLAIFALVMGSIYFGFATPTEAAGLGVVGALVLAALHRRLSVAMLHASFLSALKTTAMVLLIVLAAFFLNFVISLLGVPQAIARWIAELGLTPMQTILLLVVIYIALGCVLETLSMIVTTIPIVTPLAVSLGFDPVWFGIFLVIMAELALATPPVGMNLFVVQGVRPGGGSINDTIIGTLPFLAAMLLTAGILIAFPEIALWLPNRLFD
ncbi:hypothetical protein DLJ53_11080 [Acuticoccus sediminis]|uniref:TRAP transporter large permease protein n=1 Tax=Acuticoccus sediminis TaxID=2184697 RepID=A0A8B2NPW3_9HYPH|nr:TRAP transporter large permease [Acuticoccus sediminis]RAI01926.1 hypothetical protein DLJ53_11080 [Acuticoccus sediminis]